MKKDHIEVPSPASRFHKVSCSECEEVQVVYSHASTVVACNSCGNTISRPTGSKGEINGSIVGTAD